MDGRYWGIKVRARYNGSCLKKTVKYGVDLYLYTQARVNKASQKKSISMKNKLAKEVTKGKIEVYFSDINEDIGENIKGSNIETMILILFE